MFFSGYEASASSVAPCTSVNHCAVIVCKSSLLDSGQIPVCNSYAIILKCTCKTLCNFIQVDVPFLHRGDVVRMIDDMAKVYSLQKDHGEWVDDMALVSR